VVNLKIASVSYSQHVYIKKVDFVYLITKPSKQAILQRLNFENFNIDFIIVLLFKSLATKIRWCFVAYTKCATNFLSGSN